MLAIYGCATRAFVDYENYTKEECIFYYQILEKIVEPKSIRYSNYFISGLKSIVEQPGFLHRKIFETRFSVTNELSVVQIAKALKISKQGLLQRFEEGYRFIRCRDSKYDISKRIALLTYSISYLHKMIEQGCCFIKCLGIKHDINDRIDLLKQSAERLQRIQNTHGVQYASKNLPIETLPLKKRTYRCLNELGIGSVAQFMALKQQEIEGQAGIGGKTLFDIATNQTRLRNDFNNIIYDDVELSLDALGLGVRAMKCVQNIGVKTIEEFIELPQATVFNQWHIGEKTWQEIYEKQQILKYGDV